MKNVFDTAFRMDVGSSCLAAIIRDVPEESITTGFEDSPSGIPPWVIEYPEIIIIASIDGLANTE